MFNVTIGVKSSTVRIFSSIIPPDESETFTFNFSPGLLFTIPCSMTKELFETSGVIRGLFKWLSDTGSNQTVCHIPVVLP